MIENAKTQEEKSERKLQTEIGNLRKDIASEKEVRKSKIEEINGKIENLNKKV